MKSTFQACAVILYICCVNLTLNAQNSEVSFRGTKSHTQFHLYPPAPWSGDSTSIYFSEDQNGTYGMSIMYDGVTNQLQFMGKLNATEYGPHLVIDRGTNAGPRVGIGESLTGYEFNVEGDSRVSEYTQLGSDAPKIKMKKYTGTMPATQGGCAVIPHTESLDKILAVNVLVHNTSVQRVVGPNRSGTFYNFRWAAESNSSFTVCGIDGESLWLLNMPISILVTYEE